MIILPTGKPRLYIWLDDERRPPPRVPFEWFWVSRVDTVKELIREGLVCEISFDHDLGEDQPTGYDLAKWIEEGAAQGEISTIIWEVHSQNPVGAENIRRAMTAARRTWERTRF